MPSTLQNALHVFCEHLIEEVLLLSMFRGEEIQVSKVNLKC